MKKVLGRAFLTQFFFFLTAIGNQDCIKEPLRIFFNTSFLTQYDKVRCRLIEHGFVAVTFKAPDGLIISGLYLERPDARCTVICCAGWYPGRKEGMASLYPLIPEDCNILFFDARGHGQSESSLWWHVWNYGTQEYLDIHGALDFVTTNKKLPVILLGVCAGAFNAVHASIRVADTSSYMPIVGVVFDSGWTSVDTIAYTALAGQSDRAIARGIAHLYSGNRKVADTWLFAIGSGCVRFLLSGIKLLFFKGGFMYYDARVDLYRSIKAMPYKIPVLFIHAQDDTYAQIGPVHALAALIEDKRCWWIEKPSKHACHYLKYTQEYRAHLHAFIDELIPKYVTA